MTKMEDDQNERRPKWKTTKMKDDQNGRRPKWKTIKMEDNQNERRPKLKMTKMEDDYNGILPKWSTTKIRDNQNERCLGGISAKNIKEMWCLRQNKDSICHQMWFLEDKGASYPRFARFLFLHFISN